MFQTWTTTSAAATLLFGLAAASTGSLLNSSIVSGDNGFGPRNGNSGILPCEALKEAGLGDRILFPTDPGYEPQIQTWYAENSRVRPYCLILPQSTAEVSTALTALVNANDGAGDWHIAVRSGGHSTIGSNNIENGVTIDLSYMNSSSYDEATNLAKIQPGGRWRNVYADLEKYGVTAAGGRDGDVGVGGFLLGGGNSFYTGRMGFGCDSVVNFEVVLGNGTVINANSTANADLWQALKGGSSNFGIVTRFDMEAIPSRKLYHDTRFLDFNYSEAVLEAVVGYANADQSLADNAFITFFIYNGSESSDILIGTIYVNTYGNGNVTIPFDDVKSLPALLNETTIESMADAALGSQVAGGARSAGSTLTFRNDLQMARRCVDVFVDYIDSLKQSIGAENFLTAMFLQPIPSYIGQIGHQRGGNMLGLDNIEDNALLWTTGTSANTAGDHAVAQAGLNAMTAQLKEISKSTATDLDFLYLNYADANQDILGNYGAKNIQHMRDVAARYDPAEIFQKRIPGGFKLSRCDICKARKTKCDRRSPCASCVTLNVTCRTSSRPTEKRQRVLLSAKYDEAMQDVSRQLSDVKEMLQALTLGKNPSPCPTGGSSDYAHHTPRSMIDEQVPSLSSVHEGFAGDSSFQSYAHRVKNALEATLTASELISVEALEVPTILPQHTVAEPLHGPGTTGSSTSANAALGPLPWSHDLGFGNMPLPPIDAVLSLLRLTKTTKQRFFVDVPLFDEAEFTNLCRDVYFATEPISLWTWISVDVGLYYLFFGVNEDDCRWMGTTIEAMRSHGKMLKANAEAAMQSLRLCSEPSTESCRALALLVSHSTIAWRLISGAARAALDLGLHRLPNNTNSEEIARKGSIFWYIYTWDTGLAMTCGRTPGIHHYDVTTCHPVSPEQRHDTPGRVYAAFIDYAIVTGEIQQKLFSASARQASQEVRIQRVREFAARIIAIQSSITYPNQEYPTPDEMFSAAAVALNIMMYSLLTIVYRILPPSSVQAHPLQCSDECVDAARIALTKLVKVGEHMLRVSPVGWSFLLNLILSLVPFVSFIVLAGNAIATSSSGDLALLSSVVSVMAPAAANSPIARKMHDACERFGRIANRIVSSASEGPMSHKVYQEQVFDNGGLSLGVATDGTTAMPDHTHAAPFGYGYPMAQHDWDSAMMGFESELGDYDSRDLTNIIEPYFANMGWRF
ncbi:hypothetical protein F4810DRAFT_700572 [Camillea tinctor]|nr:hypothetical protein F4810DRAFT_700572 [Camillea tinctor]